MVKKKNHYFRSGEETNAEVHTEYLIESVINTVCKNEPYFLITSPGWMHETSAWTWCTGKT